METNEAGRKEPADFRNALIGRHLVRLEGVLHGVGSVPAAMVGKSLRLSGSLIRQRRFHSKISELARTCGDERRFAQGCVVDLASGLSTGGARRFASQK